MGPKQSLFLVAAIAGGLGCGGDEADTMPNNFDLLAVERTVDAPARSVCETGVLQSHSFRGGPAAYTMTRAGGPAVAVPCTVADDTLTCEGSDPATGELFHWTLAMFPDYKTATFSLDYDGPDPGDCVGSVIVNLQPYK